MHRAPNPIGRLEPTPHPKSAILARPSGGAEHDVQRLNVPVLDASLLARARSDCALVVRGGDERHHPLMRCGQARPHCHRLRSSGTATWSWEVFLSPVPWGASHGHKCSSTDADADAGRGCARCSAGEHQQVRSEVRMGRPNQEPELGSSFFIYFFQKNAGFIFFEIEITQLKMSMCLHDLYTLTAFFTFTNYWSQYEISHF